MRRIALLLAVWTVLAPGSLRCQESSAPELPLSIVEDARANGLKAPYLFNLRGRRDPFVNSNQWRSAGSKAFDVTLLELKGTLEVNGAKAVLFVRATDRAVFTLRGQRLFGADGKAVAGVSGRIFDNHQVQLRQGEQSLNFGAFRKVKRKF